MKVEIWLHKNNKPIKHEATSTYIDGKLFYVYCVDKKIHKYSIRRLSRVIEDHKISEK